jgi:hypothetical protein
VLFNLDQPYDPQVIKSLDSVTRVEEDGRQVIVYGRSVQPGQPR